MKKYSFTEEEIDAIYEFVYIAQDVSEDREEINFLREILQKIDVQSDYKRPEIQDYSIHIPNTDYTDFVYGTDRDDAIVRWTEEYLDLEVKEQSRPMRL